MRAAPRGTPRSHAANLQSSDRLCSQQSGQRRYGRILRAEESRLSVIDRLSLVEVHNKAKKDRADRLGDCTEINMRLGNLLVEAKLAKYDFQATPRRLIERYRNLEDVFDLKTLEIDGTAVQSYQLIRGVLTAYALPATAFVSFAMPDGRTLSMLGAGYSWL